MALADDDVEDDDLLTEADATAWTGVGAIERVEVDEEEEEEDEEEEEEIDKEEDDEDEREDTLLVLELEESEEVVDGATELVKVPVYKLGM